ncbi:MAG: hypothetical protein O3C34_03795 [Proteobacteria bacterium]|nr:hypothetical protein [Pseudomonadota bacterium]
MSDLSGLPVKRRRRTREQIEQLQRQIHDVLFEDNPQSIRHVFYRMTNPRLEEPVDKSDHGYAQVQQQITKMRRAGTLPYGWITDATRRGYHVNTYRGASDFLASMAGLYRADLWQFADHYVEVWCESRSIAGVIERECRDLAVSLYPAGGFSSLTLAFQAAEYINEVAKEVPAEIIYIGDYDPAGVLIDRSIERELRQHLDDDVDLNFHRLAINKDQVIEHDLPTKPRKAGDKRALHITETVEAEAMPAGVMHQLLRETIESFLPRDALAITEAAEQSEKLVIRGLAQSLAEIG